MIYVGIVAIFGIAITLVGDYYCLVVGRFIQGLCGGYYTILCPLYSNKRKPSFPVREISPNEISGYLCTFFVLFV